MKEPKVKSGEPRYYGFNTLYYFYCCDCGLCHATLFSLVKRKKKLWLEKVTYRDDYESTRRRRDIDKEGIEYLVSLINSSRKQIKKRLKKNEKSKEK